MRKKRIAKYAYVLRCTALSLCIEADGLNDGKVIGTSIHSRESQETPPTSRPSPALTAAAREGLLSYIS